MTTLRDATAAAEQAINDALGDEITYDPSSGAATTFNAWVDFGNADVSTGNSSSNAESIVIEVPYAKVALPDRADRITIALRPGNIYAPAGWEQGATGSTWRIPLKRVSA